MHEERITESPAWSDPRGQVMKTPDDVAEMLRLRACGWSARVAGIGTGSNPISRLSTTVVLLGWDSIMDAWPLSWQIAG